MINAPRPTWSVVRRLIGEFVVIVMGVLTALAVDDFREKRREHREERYWLTLMTENLDADLGELSQIIARAERKQAAAAVIEALVNPRPTAVEPASPEASARMPFDTALLTLAATLDFDITTVAYDALAATGSLRVITNPVLRGTVASHYHYVGAQNLTAASEQHVRQQFHDVLARHGVTVVDSANEARLAAVIRANPEVAARVRLMAGNARILLQQFRQFEKRTHALRNDIQAELNRRPQALPR